MRHVGRFVGFVEFDAQRNIGSLEARKVSFWAVIFDFRRFVVDFRAVIIARTTLAPKVSRNMADSSAIIIRRRVSLSVTVCPLISRRGLIIRLWGVF